MAKVGGLSEIKDADAEVQSIVDKVLGDVNTQTGENYSKLTAVKYATQVVAGTNYFVKVCVDGDKYLHLRIYQPLPHTNQGPELAGVQNQKSLEDPLQFFEETKDMSMMCGGVGEIKDADAEVQAVVDKVLDDVNKQTGESYSKLTAVKYATQVVAGTNYFVKVSMGGDKYLHIKIYQPLPHTNEGPKLTGVQKDKTLEDDLGFF